MLVGSGSVNSSLSEGVIPLSLKETVICFLLKKISLDPTILDKAKLVLLVTFITVDYGILLDQLRGLEVGGTVFSWFTSFPQGRFQSKMIG